MQNQTFMQLDAIIAGYSLVGMHLAYVPKGSFQVFFFDVYFGLKDILLFHLQTDLLDKKLLSKV